MARFHSYMSSMRSVTPEERIEGHCGGWGKRETAAKGIAFDLSATRARVCVYSTIHGRERERALSDVQAIQSVLHNHNHPRSKWWNPCNTCCGPAILRISSKHADGQ